MASGIDMRDAKGICAAVLVRPVTVDDLSNVRYVHASAFKALASSHYSEDEVAAFAAYVYTPGYDDLIYGENMLAGFLDGQMVATASWAPADDNGISARTRSVFVRPMFGGLGIGRRLVLETESWARRSGFRSFGARVTLNAVGFFEALGYEVTSHGVHLLPDNRSLPVSFMRKPESSEPAGEPAA